MQQGQSSELLKAQQGPPSHCAPQLSPGTVAAWQPRTALQSGSLEPWCAPPLEGGTEKPSCSFLYFKPLGNTLSEGTISSSEKQQHSWCYFTGLLCAVREIMGFQAPSKWEPNSCQVHIPRVTLHKHNLSVHRQVKPVPGLSAREPAWTWNPAPGPSNCSI